MTIEYFRQDRAAAGLLRSAAQRRVMGGLRALPRLWKALKRQADRPQRIRLDEMSAYLLRDLGLPPDPR